MVTARTGKAWRKRLGDETYITPDLEQGKYYILINAFITNNDEIECYTFEEVEIID